VSADRERTPQPQQPFAMPVQATFQQAPVWHQSPQPLQGVAPSPAEKFRQALALHQQGRFGEAERLYNEVLAQSPAQFDAMHLLGVLALQTQRTERGVELIARAIAINPNSWGARNNLGNGLRDLGRLDDALASFDGAIALKPDFAEAHNNRGIVLRDQRRFDDAVAAFDRAIALKPDYAEAHNNRGTVLQELKRFDDALAGFDTAVARKRDYAEAYNNRGNVLKELKRFDDALASFDSAIASRPDYATAHYNRGTVLQELGRADHALASFDTAIRLRPDYPEAYNNRGLVLQELGRPDDAIASFAKTIALKPGYAEPYANQSFCFLQLGRFEQGWRQYEWRKKLETPFGNRSFSQPLWLGKEDIANRTLFVHWEQGLGDTIQFCRLAALVKAQGARVIMSVQEPLYRLVGQSSRDIEIIREDEVPAAFDYHCPLMSLPLALGTMLQTIPSPRSYLFADHELRKAWHARLPATTKPRVGFVWRGGEKHPNNPNRSMDFSAFAPLLATDMQWISLQKELRPADAALLRHFDRVASYSEELQDLSDTAAIIDLLDLVITVDTGVAHLAGAMGKPVWIMLAYNADWRWLLHRDDCPWYPSARLFRQDRPRDWDDVIARVRAALRASF